MSYYNHFSKNKFQPISFISLKIGEKFRNDFFKNGRRRADIICIKTSELTYIEQKSKKEHKFIFVDDKNMVSSYDHIIPTS